ncbi:glycosyltransferase [Patescibacteria group bacterium]|nr:glycosyltransferase [Patescibacteria group bacterium]
MTKTILYIVNSYGTPPLNYFEKYLKENRTALLTIIKLPAIRLIENRMKIDAFVKDENGQIHAISLNLPFPFPFFLVFLVQYFINFILCFILLTKLKRKRFALAIGETNFGSCIAFIIKKLGLARFSVFFNGDIIPDPAWSNSSFFLPNHKQRHPLSKFVDNLLINIQSGLRRIGYKNDLIWFASKKIASYDAAKGLRPKKKIINDPILVDYNQTLKYSRYKKKMNTLCYIGRVDNYVGLEIIIPALNKIKEAIVDIHLLIIGGNEMAFETYRRLAIKHRVINHITYYGYVSETDKALALMSRAALGMALYKPVKDNVSMYTQPGKPKDYIGVGIPVLLSNHGPEIGREIVRYCAGVASDFNIASVARTITEVLTNQRLYATLQKGVLCFAKAYDYRNRFTEIWEELKQNTKTEL